MFLFKGPNTLIQYSIVGGDGAFRVTENGDVIVNASLDYEVETKYEFQVKKDYFWRLFFYRSKLFWKTYRQKLKQNIKIKVLVNTNRCLEYIANRNYVFKI